MTATNTDAVQPFFWAEYRDTTMGRYLGQRETAFVKRFLGVAAQPCRVLDIGCGSGVLTLQLHEAGHNVVGVDIDTEALTAFRQRSSEVLLIRGDAHRLPFGDSSFNCVVALECLQELDHRRFLQECNRILCNGGLLIFESLNRHNYKRVLRKLLDHVADIGLFQNSMKRSPRVAGFYERFGHIADLTPSYNWSCGEILQATSDHGFDIQAVSGINWVPFDRFSNSGLVTVAALVEKTLRLHHLYRISPWILVAARKRSL